MEYIDLVIRQIIDNFNFAFMFIINVLSYLIVRLVYGVKKGAYVTTWSKRFIFMACTVGVAIIYKLGGYDSNVKIINSAILAPVFWDWILRPIFIKLNIDYSKFEKYDDDVDTTIVTKDTVIKVESKDK